MTEYIDRIKELLPEEELLCQLAEESVELAQAALKLRRTIDKTNYTPVSKEDAAMCLLEEAADVIACLYTVNVHVEDERLQEIQRFKFERWVNRLKNQRQQTGEPSKGR